MVRINKIKHVNIYSNMNGGYIVHNTKKDFSIGHTHINNYNTAKYIAQLIAYNSIPKKGHLSLYLLDSLIRLSNNNIYTSKIKNIKRKELQKK